MRRGEARDARQARGEACEARQCVREGATRRDAMRGQALVIKNMWRGMVRQKNHACEAIHLTSFKHSSSQTWLEMGNVQNNVKTLISRTNSFAL